ncbi:hypothetical protein ACE102_25400 [Bradyrhizobium sp. vgs-9]|uniref:hypothetical protein n=1 Tax=Bradyrhizobium sp. vgs-9 TaxID=208389 RepID=UPI0035D4E2BD
MPIPSIARNAFHHTLVEFSAAQDSNSIDLFSKAAIQTYEAKAWKEWGYQFTQIFEPGVLREVALLEGLSYDAMQSMTHRPSAALRWLGERVDAPEELCFREKINVAAALISVSRFAAAALLVEAAVREAVSPRDRFELGWLEFLISNRCDDGARSPRAFQRMRTAIDEGSIPPSRVLDMCTQGVVWYVKRREVSETDYGWCKATGTNIVDQRTGVDGGAISSWYRGMAMVPAAKGDALLTRDYMGRAKAAAVQARSAKPSAFEMNGIKTYYESTIKEHMYVTKDIDRALAAADDLIALDPNWSPSYGECADANRSFGRLEAAAELYEYAARLGPPYVGHHLLQAARCCAAVDAPEQALAHYETLAVMAPDFLPVREEAERVAERAEASSRKRYRETLEALRVS